MYSSMDPNEGAGLGIALVILLPFLALFIVAVYKLFMRFKTARTLRNRIIRIIPGAKERRIDRHLPKRRAA